MSRPVAITGANGFIGRNLRLRLQEAGYGTVAVPHDAAPAEMAQALECAAVVFHLAGVNRPRDEAEFAAGNVGMTERLVAALRRLPTPLPVVFASSIQAANDTPYGRSKRQAESLLADYGAATGAAVQAFRLPNVFGKWCRPDYNSVVATFCHRLANGLPIEIHDPAAPLRLVYVDDLAEAWLALAPGDFAADPDARLGPVYETTVGALAQMIRAFADSREGGLIPPLGDGLARALCATFLSAVPAPRFAYDLVRHDDPRGTFVEMLKTREGGQVSFFTAYPGVTRGGHYHHTKTEKFLVVQGTAEFRFRHMITGDRHALVTSGARPQIVDTVPGWAHDITNVGDDVLVVLLWASEPFDAGRPDTIAHRLAAAS